MVGAGRLQEAKVLIQDPERLVAQLLPAHNTAAVFRLSQARRHIYEAAPGEELAFHCGAARRGVGQGVAFSLCAGAAAHILFWKDATPKGVLPSGPRE